jgi:predicted dehydrogenase
LKFLIIGLGSMGKRRIRNLRALNAGEIIGFEIQDQRRAEVEKEYGIKTYASLDEGLAQKPDALIISTPPNLHMQYALEAARRGLNFFMEASVVLDSEMDRLISLCKSGQFVAAPSATMRFHPSVQVMKRLVDEGTIGKILAFNYHSGQYLPDWHPWEDYRTYYVAKRETGGCREIVPFELSWITWLMGPVRSISCILGKLTKLEIDIDDIYQLLLEFESGVIASMQVDVISRVAYRYFKMISEEGVMIWDWNRRMVSVYTASTKAWVEYPQSSGKVVQGYVMEDDMYVSEMQHFIRAVQGKDKYMYSLEDDKRILELLNAAEKSWKEHKILKIMN